MIPPCPRPRPLRPRPLIPRPLIPRALTPKRPGAPMSPEAPIRPPPMMPGARILLVATELGPTMRAPLERTDVAGDTMVAAAGATAATAAGALEIDPALAEMVPIQP